MISYTTVSENCQLADGKKHGDKWYPFNSVTNYGSVWRKIEVKHSQTTNPPIHQLVA